MFSAVFVYLKVMPRSNLKMEDYYDDEQLTHEEKKLWPIGFTYLSPFRHHHYIGRESETVRRKMSEGRREVSVIVRGRCIKSGLKKQEKWIFLG